MLPLPNMCSPTVERRHRESVFFHFGIENLEERVKKYPVWYGCMAFLDFFYLCWLVVVGHLIKMCVLICYSFWPAARPVMYSAHSNQFIKNQELSFSQFCCPKGQRIKICVLCYSCGQQLGLQYCHWPRLAPGVGQIFSLRTFSAPGWTEMSSVS